MDITLSLDEHEVTALRSGSHIPVSLRDKLGDAVEIRDVGWYLLADPDGSSAPLWWDGKAWRIMAGDANSILPDNPDSAQRLYLAEEV